MHRAHLHQMPTRRCFDPTCKEGSQEGYLGYRTFPAQTTLLRGLPLAPKWQGRGWSRGLGSQIRLIGPLNHGPPVPVARVIQVLQV